MALMTFISWIYHFWARFWPYFNFVDFRAYFGHFSHVKKSKQLIADLVMKMASNQKMQENKPTSKFNFTIEKKVTRFKIFILTFSLSPIIHVASIETTVWRYFWHLVTQCCTSIHHLTRYLSTLYRLTRNLSTTQIYHLARDLDVSRKLNCVLLNLKNKTFSCNAMSSTITVFFW